MSSIVTLVVFWADSEAWYTPKRFLFPSSEPHVHHHAYHDGFNFSMKHSRKPVIQCSLNWSKYFIKPYSLMEKAQDLTLITLSIQSLHFPHLLPHPLNQHSSLLLYSLLLQYCQLVMIHTRCSTHTNSLIIWLADQIDGCAFW